MSGMLHRGHLPFFLERVDDPSIVLLVDFQMHFDNAVVGDSHIGETVLADTRRPARFGRRQDSQEDQVPINISVVFFEMFCRADEFLAAEEGECK